MISSINFLPHGMQIIPNLDKTDNPKFATINDSMVQITNHLQIENPDLIILFTPHGYNLEENFLVYLHNSYEGKYFEISPDASVVHGEFKYSREWIGDAELSQKLIDVLKKPNFPVEGLIQGFSNYPITLAWGETVPLFYLPEESKTKTIIIGIPRSRHVDINGLQPKLGKLMDLVLEFDKSLDLKISLVFSGDLSHTHDKDGPYGYDPSSKTFDDLVIQWAKTQSNVDYETILELQPTALACGMAGMGMINDLFSKLTLQNQMIFYELPTYFGMMVARWLPV